MIEPRTLKNLIRDQVEEQVQIEIANIENEVFAAMKKRLTSRFKNNRNLFVEQVLKNYAVYDQGYRIIIEMKKL
jgi:hypothetical protein